MSLSSSKINNKFNTPAKYNSSSIFSQQQLQSILQKDQNNETSIGLFSQRLNSQQQRLSQNWRVYVQIQLDNSQDEGTSSISQCQNLILSISKEAEISELKNKLLRILIQEQIIKLYPKQQYPRFTLKHNNYLVPSCEIVQDIIDPGAQLIAIIKSSKICQGSQQSNKRTNLMAVKQLNQYSQIQNQVQLGRLLRIKKSQAYQDFQIPMSKYKRNDGPSRLQTNQEDEMIRGARQQTFSFASAKSSTKKSKGRPKKHKRRKEIQINSINSESQRENQFIEPIQPQKFNYMQQQISEVYYSRQQQPQYKTTNVQNQEKEKYNQKADQCQQRPRVTERESQNGRNSSGEENKLRKLKIRSQPAPTPSLTSNSNMQFSSSQTSNMISSSFNSVSLYDKGSFNQDDSEFNLKNDCNQGLKKSYNKLSSKHSAGRTHENETLDSMNQKSLRNQTGNQILIKISNKQQDKLENSRQQRAQIVQNQQEDEDCDEDDDNQEDEDDQEDQDQNDLLRKQWGIKNSSQINNAMQNRQLSKNYQQKNLFA